MSDWRLNKLEIETDHWGKEKTGKEYKGKITFRNKEYESFCINIPPERMELFVSLISDEVIHEASLLGDKIAQSLKKQSS